MPQIERNIAAVFLVFAGIYVNQFSLPLAIAVLVAAILVHRGYQMSDLKVNVHNSNRVQTLASSLYTWTEHAVSAIAEKCKLLTNTENRASPPNASSHLESDVRQDYYPEAENVFNRENLYRGNNLMQVRKVKDRFPEKTSPYSSTTPGRQTKSHSPSSVNFSETFGSPHHRISEKESLTPRDSPWGYSLSPQQRGPVADVKPVQAIAGPLLASAKYNAKRNSNLYVDVSSPGFSSRLLKYSEAATHQPQYARPGQLPLVHLNKSPMPTLSPHNSRKVQVPVRLRIAPPSYDASESRLFSRNGHQQELEQQSKSVVDVLKEISRKRFRTEDIVSDPKRHHRSDSSSSSSSSSSPAFGNEMSCDQTPSGKRPREEDSPKLQKKSIKRTHNNEIFSSLSSSRNIRVGMKRKAVDNLSRSTTPSPIGKLLKKSPHITPIGASEVVLKTSEHSSQQQELAAKPKESLRKEEKVSSSRPSVSQIHSQEVVRDPKPSTCQLEEPQKGEDKPSKVQPSKNQYGRLFAKTLSKGTPVLQESAKGKKKSGGTIPWVSHATADIDAITEEDILSEDFTHGNRRLNRMLSVISSAGNASSDSSKGDMVDGKSTIQSSSKPSDNVQETKSTSTSEADKQGMGDATKIIPEKNLPSAAPSIIEIKEPRPISSTSEVTLPKPELVTAPSTVVSTSTLSPSLSTFKASSSTPSSLTTSNIKQTSGDSSVITPITLAQSISCPVLASPATSSAFSLPQTTPVSVPATSQVTLSNPSSSTIQTQPSASLTGTLRSCISVTSAPVIFGAQKLEEKQLVSSSPCFLFGVSSASNAPAASNSKPVFSLPTSNVAAIPTASTALQSNTSSPFSVTSTSTVSSSSTASTVKPASNAVTSGGFTFGTAPAVTSSSIEFPKTVSSVISFGGINTPTTSVTSSQTVAPSLINSKNTTSAATDTSSKPTFSFGALPTSSAPVPATTASGGFHFKFGTSSQSSVTVPKPQESGTGFKFTFDANKESTPLSQPSAPALSKPPTFGGGFSFGATSSTNPQESKTMTFGTTGSINPAPTAAAGAASAGFSFSATNDPGSNIQKPAFGLGATASSAAPSNSLSSGGFNFGVKPAESTAMAPSAPNVAAPFQFGASSTAPGLPVQQQQAPVMGNPFSIGGTSEQKPMEERFTFGSVQSTSMSTTLQANPPSFEQPALSSFNSPNVNPLQNPAPANSSLFRFSSSGAVGQPGMFSGGCSFGQTTATGVASTGFNFNPTGPSATTPFQFGATPATPMFSIGSGSTAPRSRPRNRRQK